MAEIQSRADGALPEFRIGLAMAGAISAGAYTAGVMDFLLQALAEWEAIGLAGLAGALDDPDDGTALPDAPGHRVSIASLSGASAGGMTSAIAAAVVGGTLTPVTAVPATGAVDNKFYESWVVKVDIAHFLKDDDMRDSGGKVVSLLDSTMLEMIANDAIRISGPDPKRPFIADPLPVFLTVANLRGVPYHIGLAGQGSAGHGMTMHSDYMEFYVTRDPAKVPGTAMWLDPGNYDTDNWRLLAASALASGAFPGGLAPRMLHRDVASYNDRDWPVPGEDGTTFEKIPSDLPFDDTEPFDFLNVDGGLMNNEPLELARRALRQPGEGSRNSRDGLKADRAVIMIDPFPSSPYNASRRVKGDLLSVIMAMFASLKAEARFKPQELALAARSSVYSRYMISPTRTPAGGELPEKYAIASGSLGGFGGFLSEAFRRHDFNLGRRNCQMFLRRHLLLPKGNDLFANWPDALKGAMGRPKPGVDGGPDDHLPVVPLVGSADQPVPSVAWPSMSEAELEALDGGVGRRAKVVVKALLAEHIHWAVACLGWWVLGKKIRRKIMGKIRDSLAEFGLLG